MKKLVSVFLTLLLLCSVATLTAHAESFSGTCGANITWTFDTGTGVLDVAGTGPMYAYNHTTRPGYDLFLSSVKTVKIADGVTSIGAYAFLNFTRITDVSIPASVKTINRWAFYGCQSLNDVVLPEGVESIEENAFAFCSSLKKITIPESVTFIDTNAFMGVSGLVIHCYMGSTADDFVNSKLGIRSVYLVKQSKTLESWESKLPAWMGWAKNLAPGFQWMIIIFLFGWVWFL